MYDFCRLLCFSIVLRLASTNYVVNLSTDSPVVLGGTLHFKASLLDNNDNAQGSFKFHWIDNTTHRNERTIETNSSHDTWNVTYTGISQGTYNVEVTVSKYIIIFYYTVATRAISFNVTDSLNGQLNIRQGNQTIKNFVSNNETVLHEVDLSKADTNYIQNSSLSALTYWFINCNYYGISNNFKFMHNYSIPEEEYLIEALVVAGYVPITTTTLPTTIATSTTSTTTTVTPVTLTTISTTIKPGIESNISTSNLQMVNYNKTIKKREISTLILPKSMATPDKIFTYNDNMLIASNQTLSMKNKFPFICNNTIVPVSENNTYGYFSTVVTVKVPVSNVQVTGNNWLKEGNILELNVKCNGSKSFNHCVMFYSGIYNVTNNETCSNPIQNDTCDFNIGRYYGAPGIHTILIIISNNVGKSISTVTVTVYEVPKNAQLSVIVVPVSFSIVAVILIVFGVAYYIQNRTKFTIEVADFNFGPQYMEYMTFKERLWDSIGNAFSRGSTVNVNDDSASGPIWPPNRRYGSMT